MQSTPGEEQDLEETASMRLDDRFSSDEPNLNAGPATAKDTKFMKLAQEAAMNSKDKQTKVG